MDDECQIAEVTFEAVTESRATEVASNARQSLEDAPILSEALPQELGPVLQVGGHGAQVAINRGKYLVEFTADGNAALRNGLVTFLHRADGRAQATLVSRAGIIQENAVLGRPWHSAQPWRFPSYTSPYCSLSSHSSLRWSVRWRASR